MRNLRVLVANQSAEDVPGTLGLDLLGKQRLLFDFPGKKLYVSLPSGASAASPARKPAPQH